MNVPGSPLDEIERLEQELAQAREQLRVTTLERDRAVDAFQEAHRRVLDIRQVAVAPLAKVGITKTKDHDRQAA